MSSTLTPNMNLVVPTVGNQPGPDYANNINGDMGIIDGHDHTPGKGVLITPSGLNINTALTLNGNFLTNAAGVTLSAQASTPGLGTIYESGVDLFYVDGIGNNIRLTQSGAVAGTPGSIANLVPPASASYVSGSSTFVWQSNTSIAANMDFGAAIFRNLSPNSTFGVTVQAPTALGSNYTLTLPSIPVSIAFLTLDTSGNISPSVSENQGITGSMIASQTITTTNIANQAITATQIANQTITATQIANATITGAKVASATITGANIVSNANFDGNSTQVNGKDIVVSQVNAGSGLGIVRGGVASDGTIVFGDGFSVSPGTTGIYHITYSLTYNPNPIVVAGVWTTSSAPTSAIVVYVNSSTVNGFTVTVLSSTAVPVNAPFSFIAIGPR